MGLEMPDPLKSARALAEAIKARREEIVQSPVDRVIADSPDVDRRVVLEGVTRFHRERIGKTPSVAKYPEAAPWVEYHRVFEKELREKAGLDDTDVAVVLSLGLYMPFRGYRMCRPPVAGDEKCRVAYLPESDRGPIHIANGDDPITYWKPDRVRPAKLPQAGGLCIDGVGSGMHLDDEPDELYPLPVQLMAVTLGLNDVPSATEFFTRYCPFWGGSNMLLHDDQKRSVAIEKCSYKHIEVFHPGSDGRSHISGMTCRDPKSRLGAFQAAKRQEYLTLYKRPADCIDIAFWGKCKELEDKLAQGLKAMPAMARAADVFALFTDTYPKGLNKPGLKLHPTEGLVSYTLITRATLQREKKLLVWNRSEDGKTFDAEATVYAY
jgi:hypothetical protein